MIKRPQQSNNLLEKFSAFGRKIKALLTKDYSVEDLRNLPKTLTNTLKDWWNQAAGGSSQSQANGLNVDQDTKGTENAVLLKSSGGTQCRVPSRAGLTIWRKTSTKARLNIKWCQFLKVVTTKP